MMKTDGRVVIPKKLREAIGAKESSLLEISLYQVHGKNKLLIEVLQV